MMRGVLDSVRQASAETTPGNGVAAGLVNTCATFNKGSVISTRIKRRSNNWENTRSDEWTGNYGRGFQFFRVSMTTDRVSMALDSTWSVKTWTVCKTLACWRSPKRPNGAMDRYNCAMKARGFQIGFLIITCGRYERITTVGLKRNPDKNGLNDKRYIYRAPSRPPTGKARFKNQLF